MKWFSGGYFSCFYPTYHRECGTERGCVFCNRMVLSMWENHDQPPNVPVSALPSPHAWDFHGFGKKLSGARGGKSFPLWQHGHTQAPGSALCWPGASAQIWGKQGNNMRTVESQKVGELGCVLRAAPWRGGHWRGWREREGSLSSVSPPAQALLLLLVNTSNTRTPPVLTSPTRPPPCPSAFILPVIFLPFVQILHRSCTSLASSAPNLCLSLGSTSALQIWVPEPEKQLFWVILSMDCILISLCHGVGAMSPSLLSLLSRSTPNSSLCQRTILEPFYYPASGHSIIFMAAPKNGLWVYALDKSTSPCLMEGVFCLFAASLILLGLLIFAPMKIIFQLWVFCPRMGPAAPGPLHDLAVTFHPDQWATNM